jgi:hypothetical protein
MFLEKNRYQNNQHWAFRHHSCGLKSPMAKSFPGLSACTQLFIIHLCDIRNAKRQLSINMLPPHGSEPAPLLVSVSEPEPLNKFPLNE